MDREEELWLIHDLDLFVENEEDIYALSELEFKLMSKGIRFAINVDDEEADDDEM